MTGFNFTIVSPSKVTFIRNTPCVLGCCGPRLTSSVCVSSVGASLRVYSILVYPASLRETNYPFPPPSWGRTKVGGSTISLSPHPYLPPQGGKEVFNCSSQ